MRTCCLRKILLSAAAVSATVLTPFCAARTQQLDPLSHPSPAIPLTHPELSPGVLELLTLDGEFAQSVAKGGGAAFGSWFADDGMTLNNGKDPVLGKARVAASANWDPKQYQLTWQPLGGQMGPDGNMGFTWGHYEGHSRDAKGNDVSTHGRYITVWKKVNGKWKVALDAGADEPPAAGECCTLPKP